MRNILDTTLDALASRQNEEGRKVILPIWHEIGANEVQKHSPLLAGLLAVRSQDGLDSVVSQIITVCSEPEVFESGQVFSKSSGKSGLRERCLGIIRGGNVSDWRKLVDEIQYPIEEQLLEWKEGSEKVINQGDEAWKSIILKATDICLPGFVPLFASIEAGQKERWKDATRILRRLAVLRDKMLAGTTNLIQIGWDMLYLPGSIGMAAAVETGQDGFLWDWMLMPMPGYQHGTEIRWADIREAF